MALGMEKRSDTKAFFGKSEKLLAHKRKGKQNKS